MDMIEVIRSWLALIPEDVSEEILANTPRRTVEAFNELTKGYGESGWEVLKEFELPKSDVNVYECCEFYSLCEHHLLPFYGKVHIGYLTKGKVFGLSKLARVVEVYSRRLQIQERLTNQIADALYNALDLHSGVFVVVEAKHLCMMMRGVKKQDAVTITQAARGRYVVGELQDRFLKILRSKKVSVK